MKLARIITCVLFVALLAGCVNQKPQLTREEKPATVAASEKTEPQLHWVDPRELTLEGKGWVDTTGPYDRLPPQAEEVVTKMVWQLSHHSAGICVRFITNSKTIKATWDGGGAMCHMAATGNSGLDLYQKRGDRWVFKGVGKPRTEITTVQLAANLPATPTEYLLYLPLYNDVTELLIGVEKDATLEKAPARKNQPIVFYGTSITQGGCAARAGMCYTAILGRWLDREVINLGFSGSGKMELPMADLCGELDSALYVLDCLPNLTTEMVKTRVVPFVKKLRQLRPDTPILLAENENLKSDHSQNVALHEAFAKLTSENVRNIHLLKCGGVLERRENGTVDGVHPTDLGFLWMAEKYEPAMRELLTQNR